MTVAPAGLSPGRAVETTRTARPIRTRAAAQRTEPKMPAIDDRAVGAADVLDGEAAVGGALEHHVAAGDLAVVERQVLRGIPPDAEPITQLECLSFQVT